MATSNNSIQLHRLLKAPAQRIYGAFLEPTALSKWIPPYGFTCTVDQFNAEVGGTYRMFFTNFSTAKSHFFGGKYIELIPNERIEYIDQFEDPKMPDEMQVTITLKPVICGTEIHIIQEGIPAAIPLEICYLGWQESLIQLAQLVEPEISDND